MNKLFLVELVLPNLFLVLSRELVENNESLCLVLDEALFLLMEFLLLLFMLLGLLRVLGLNRVANLGLAVVVVVCDLTVFLNLVRVLVLGGEVALLSNLDAARERDLGLEIREVVVCSGTSEGACLLKAV